MCNAWCTSLAYDGEAKYAFVGDLTSTVPLGRCILCLVHTEIWRLNADSIAINQDYAAKIAC